MFWYAERVPLRSKRRKERKPSMGLRVLKVVAVLTLLACAAAGYFWFRVSHASSRPTLTTQPYSPPHGVARTTSGSEDRPPLTSRTAAPPIDNHRGPDSPLIPGEVLEYSANVSKLNNVANLRLQINDRRDFLGRSVWRLQAFAHTENPLRMVFQLDDQFDSYSDASSMASLQFEMHLNERGQKADSVERFTSTGREPAPPDVTEARVLPGTRDPLGMLAYLRTVDWSKTPEVRSPVYDGHKLHDVHARLDSLAVSVSVPAGDYRATKIDIKVFDDGVELKDAQFSLYLANNAARTPVLIEAVIPVATARVELVKAATAR
jgi:uncharacterized protein DUF3108